MQSLYDKELKFPIDMRKIGVSSCNLGECIEIASFNDFFELLRAASVNYFYFVEEFGYAEKFELSSAGCGICGRNAVMSFESSVEAFNERLRTVDYSKPIRKRIFFYQRDRVFAFTEYASLELQLVMSGKDALDTIHAWQRLDGNKVELSKE